MTLSTKLFDEATRLFPGGVNSPVRAWRNVEGTPLFLVKPGSFMNVTGPVVARLSRKLHLDPGDLVLRLLLRRRRYRGRRGHRWLLRLQIQRFRLCLLEMAEKRFRQP